MKSVPLLVSDPGVFAYVDGQTYYNELLAHTILEHAYRMTEEGYELTFEEFSLEDAWDTQDSTLTQQSTLITELESSDKLSSGWKTRLGSIKTLITSLLGFTETSENLTVRGAMISIFENTIGTASSLAQTAVTENEDLNEILKTAFLEETVPGSGIYTSSTIAELKASSEHLEVILQAIQDLKYNEEILEVPATPRPIRIHLQSKTIQQ